tara:strand:- start:1969 stop:2142 length:174 start_codon:yes stop_codon:yes gene_type:complete
MSSELDALNIETEKNLNLKKQDWLVIEEDSESWELHLFKENTMAKGKRKTTNAQYDR